jgi:hypothetical protein
MSVFYGNDNGLFTKFTIELMEERMKAIEQKNDGSSKLYMGRMR